MKSQLGASHVWYVSYDEQADSVLQATGIGW